MFQFRLNLVQTNKFMQRTSPWELAKSTSDEDQERLDQIIFLAADAIRVCAILLQPYMPGTMYRLLDMLGVDQARRSFEFAHFRADFTYGISKVDLGKGHAGVLFPPLSSDF